MRITRLSATNFKGGTFEEQLGIVTIFTGPNSACKSARVEALALAVTGYIPGEKPVRSTRDIFDLYGSGNPVTVGFAVENRPALAVTRTYHEIGGSVKYTGPDRPTLPTIGWDPAEYLGLSGPKALAFICQATAGGGFDRVAELDKLCADVKNIKLEKNTPASEKAILATISDIRAWKLPTESLAEWIMALADNAAGKKTLADQSLKRSRSTVQGLAQATSGSLPDLAAEDRHAKATAIASEAKTELDKATALLEDARKQYANCKPRMGETLEQIRAKIEALRKATAGLAPAPPTKQEKEALEKAMEAKHAAKQLHSLNEEQLQHLEQMRESPEASSKCPSCNREYPKASRAKAIKELDAKIKAAKAEIAKLLTAAKKATAHHDSLAQAMTNKHEACSLRTKQEAALAAAIAEEKDAAQLPILKETGVRLAEDVRAKGAKLDEANKILADAAQANAKLLMHRAEEKTRARILEQADEAEAGALVCKAVLALVTERQEKAVKDAVQPLVDRINDLAGTLLPSPARYIDGEIKLSGWTHRTASDSEKLALYAGICLAFAYTAQIRVAIVGRFESFDRVGKMNLVKAGTRLVAEGKLDQLIIVHVAQLVGASELSEISKIEGVKVIQCNKKESK